MAMKLITASRLRAKRACPRLEYYAYGLGYRPVVPAHALRFGDAQHKALEAYWTARMLGRDVERATLEAVERLGQLLGDPVDRARGAAMLLAYGAVWGVRRVRVIAVELEFTMPLVNPATGLASTTWERAGKIDVLVEMLDEGCVALVEHKTSSEDQTPGGVFHGRLAMDGQASMYFDAANWLGYAPEKIIWDVLVKPRHAPLLATPEDKREYTKPTKKNPVSRLHAGQREHDETLEEFQRRLLDDVAARPGDFIVQYDVPRPRAELDAFALDLWEWVKRIDVDDVLGHHPRNTDACNRYGNRACAYLAVCTHSASIDDPTKFRRTKRVNPELSPRTDNVREDVEDVDGDDAPV